MSDASLLNTLRNLGLSQLVGCEQSLFDYHARVVVDEWLRHTGMLTESLPVTVVAGTDTYPLMPATTGGVIVDLLSVWQGDQPLNAANVRNLSPGVTGAPSAAGMLDARTLKLWPMPPADFVSVVLAARVTVTVQADSTSPFVIPYACQPHLTGILDGILARLYALPDKPWSSTSTTLLHRTDYMSKRNAAKQAAITSRTAGVRNWRFRRFGR